ncbi:hypothetical protein BH683_025775 [Williamsia sp. 1138]|uniref:hypothetical protein n=1 Tax=Williamsia sp. 1138 TaxID=1903117 RepID=UPI000A108392|nr:hypothetical protein [Williamsia sp. 1138]OZG26214.1 hypothetical protein BH683_025775 [Williamsia sp. 1138]
MSSDESNRLNPLATLAKQSQDTAKGYQDTADKLRARAGAWGGAIQALGLAAVAWIGFDELVNVFPTHDLGWLLAGLILLCIILMAISAIYVGWNLSVQNRPLAMSSNIQDMVDNQEISDTEADRVRGVYHQFAKLNGLNVHDQPEPQPGPSETKGQLAERRKAANAIVSNAMQAYFAPATLYEANVERAYRYDRLTNTVSAPTDDEELTKLNFGLTRAAQIRADLLLTRARAAVVVIRDRVRRATIAKKPLIAIGVFGASLIAVWFFSDAMRAYNTSDSDKIAAAKACGDARKALNDGGATFTLPDDCNAANSSGEGEAQTPSGMAVANLVALSADLSNCEAAAVVEGNLPKTLENRKVCASIRTNIDVQLALIANYE